MTNPLVKIKLNEDEQMRVEREESKKLRCRNEMITTSQNVKILQWNGSGWANEERERVVEEDFPLHQQTVEKRQRIFVYLHAASVEKFYSMLAEQEGERENPS